MLLSLQIMQSIGFLGPAFFLSQLSHVRTPAMAVLCMACSQVWASSTFWSIRISTICSKYMQNHLNLTIICYFLDRDLMHSHNLVSIPITKTLDPAMLWVFALLITLQQSINCQMWA